MIVRDELCACPVCGKLRTSPGNCADLHCEGRASHRHYWITVFREMLGIMDSHGTTENWVADHERRESPEKKS